MDKKDFAKKIFKAASTKEGMGTIGGSALGGWIGSSVGIAALGTAVAGTLPIAIVGGTIGYLGVKAYKNNKNKQSDLDKNNKDLKDAEF